MTKKDNNLSANANRRVDYTARFLRIWHRRINTSIIFNPWGHVIIFFIANIILHWIRDDLCNWTASWYGSRAYEKNKLHYTMALTPENSLTEKQSINHFYSIRLCKEGQKKPQTRMMKCIYYDRNIKIMLQFHKRPDELKRGKPVPFHLRPKSKHMMQKVDHPIFSFALVSLSTQQWGRKYFIAKLFMTRMISLIYSRDTVCTSRANVKINCCHSEKH